MNYEEKYYKYKNKNQNLYPLLALTLTLTPTLTGGATKKKKQPILDKTKYLELLYTIQNSLQDRGSNFWYSPTGKIIAKNIDKTLAYNSLIKRVEDDEDYINTIAYSINIIFHPNHITDQKKGPLEISIAAHLIKKDPQEGIIYLKSVNKPITIYYRADELRKFKLSHLRNLILAINKNKINDSKIYYYHNVKNIVER